MNPVREKILYVSTYRLYSNPQGRGRLGGSLRTDERRFRIRTNTINHRVGTWEKTAIIPGHRQGPQPHLHGS